MKKRRVKTWKTEKERQMMVTKQKNGRKNRKENWCKNQIEDAIIENGLRKKGC